MLRNYFKTAIRVLFRNPFYSFVNIIGLSLGIACALIVWMYVVIESTYDKHYEGHENIYRVTSYFTIEDKLDDFALTSFGIGRLMQKEYADIERVTLLQEYPRTLFKNEEKSFYEEGFLLADSNYFEVFSHEFIEGSPETSLNRPLTIVLTESIAQKFFGDALALGKNIQTTHRTYEVTGVIKDLPQNTHFLFDALITPSTIANPTEDQLIRSLWNVGSFTYVKMREGSSTAPILDNFAAFYDKYMAEMGKRFNANFEIGMQPLADIHLKSNLKYDRQQGNINYVYAFALIGIFILVLAAINYVNLSTARSALRSKEVGMRKVFGAGRTQLIIQYLGESIILTFIAFILSLVMMEVLFELTDFNTIIGKDLHIAQLVSSELIIGMIGILLFISLGSGLYPAFYLSKIDPIQAFQAQRMNGKAGFWIRKVLVSAQFIISISVVILTFLAKSQVDYLQNTDLGFTRDNIMNIQVRDTIVYNRLPVLMKELENHPGIAKATTTYMIPGVGVGKNLFRIEGASGMENQTFSFLRIGEEFIETIGMHIVEGRDFDLTNHPSDSSEAFIINETAVREMGYDNPIGKKVEWGFNDDGTVSVHGKIVGVVKDFNGRSLHQNIEPTLMTLQNRPGGSLILRLTGTNIQETLAFLEEKWGEMLPGQIFDYSFLDEQLSESYASDVQQSKLINIFSIVCVIISCLGLLGLSSFTIQQRTKEIAVRKILGAEVNQIMYLLFKEILMLILISSLIAFPIAHLAGEEWLKSFAYRIDMPYLIFGLIALAAVALSFVTIFYHSMRVAVTNPAVSLKYE